VRYECAVAGVARARQFRLDLYYRLAIFPIEIPPLREQKRFLAQIVQPCHRANFT
jgi:transcriptional regulator with GAF, ATPase, and Fis domain